MPLEVSPSPHVSSSLCYQHCSLSIKHKEENLHKIEQDGTKSVHWFNLVATNERVTDTSLSDQAPRCSISHIDPSIFLLSSEEIKHFKSEFKVLVLRVLCQYMTEFTELHSFVTNHIPHQHSEQATAKSQKIPLGLLDFNENKQRDMIDIMKGIKKTMSHTMQNKKDITAQS